MDRKAPYKRFVGRDRRLYFNKALCELQMGLFDDAIATCKQYLKPVKRVKQRLVLLEEQAKLSREQHAELMHNERLGMDTSTDESQERPKKPKKHNSSIKSSITKIIDRKKSVQELQNIKKVTYNDSTQPNKI